LIYAALGLPVGVALVAPAAKLFRISHKLGLNRRSPSPQAQTVRNCP